MRFKALLSKWVSLISGLIFVIFLIILGQKLQEYDFAEIINSLWAIPRTQLYLAVGLTFWGYLVIANYDRIAFAAVNYRLSTNKLLTTTFLSYAICNNVGFMLIIGGGIRYYFYNYYGVPKPVIATAIAFSNLNFWLGLLAIGGLVFSLDPIAIPDVLNLHFATVRPLGIIFLSLISIYLYLSWQQRSVKFKQQTFTLPRLSISVAQIMLSSLDWAIASAILYLLLPSQTNINYGSFFSVYLLAITARVISNVPGGLGVFETVIIYLLPQQITTKEAFVSLLAYRGIYFLLPLIISIVMLLLYEVKKRGLLSQITAYLSRSK